MSIAFVQQQSGWNCKTTTPYSLTLTLPAASTVGNAIVVNVGHYNTDTASAPLTITDTAGNTYTLIAAINAADSGPPSNNAYCSQYVCLGAAAATAVTIATGVSTRYIHAQVIEYSGVGAVRASAETAAGGSSQAATNSATDLIVSMMGGKASGTLADCVMSGTGWTALTDVNAATSNSWLLRGAWIVASAANLAGPSWSGGSLGSRGIITSSFAAAEPTITYARRIIIG